MHEDEKGDFSVITTTKVDTQLNVDMSYTEKDSCSDQSPLQAENVSGHKTSISTDGLHHHIGCLCVLLSTTYA